MKQLKLLTIIFSVFLLLACGGSNRSALTPAATPVNLFTSAPSTLNFASGAAASTYTIGGGVPPYAAGSSNATVATATISGTSLTIAGGAVGSATVMVVDSTGTKIELALTVSTSTPAPALRTTAPSAITLSLGSTNAFVVSGGTAPYSASSSNTGVVAAAVNSTTLNTIGVAAGTAQVLVTDSVGAQVAIAVTVGATAVTPLYTSANSAVTLVVGASDASYAIGGGTPPYSVSSSNVAVASSLVSGSVLTLKALSAGTSTTVVLDSTGARIELAITVNAQPTAPALRTTAPSAVSMAVGATDTFTISGGSSPYVASVSNSAVVSAVVTGTALKIVGLATGTAQVLALDSTGTQVVIGVTVGSTTAAPLFSTAASAVTLSAGAPEVTYTIGGGTPPYAVGSSNLNVATVSVTGTNLYMKGLAAGTSAVVLLDSLGAKVEIAITVATGTPATAFFTTSPSAIALSVGQTRTFTISGGLAPYASSSSNAGVATTGVSGNVLTISAWASGNATVAVFDSTGTKIDISVTVGAATPVAALYTTAGSSITLGLGSTSSYTVDGGTAPYKVSSSNAGVVTAGVSGQTLTIIAGATAGSAQVLVFDATGTQVVIAVTAGSASSATFYTSAPSAITFSSTGTSAGYIAGGGAPPYAISSSNSSVVSASLTGSNLTLLAGSAGNATVLVLDSNGSKAEIAVTVASAAVVPLFTTAPATVTVLAGTVSDTFQVSGGSSPYDARSGNTAVATVALSGTSLVITGVSAGSTTVDVTDRNNTRVSIAVNVSAVAGAALTVLPNGASGNAGDTLTFTLLGATPPYTVTVNNPSVATVSTGSVPSNGSTFTASLFNVGQTAVTVRDTLGQTTSFNITVGAATGQMRLSPSAFTVGEDEASPATISIYGGTPPYRAITSDLVVSSVPSGSLSGNTLTTSVGTSGARCISSLDSTGIYIPFGTYDVTLTVFDSAGASATSIMTVKDNGRATACMHLGPPTLTIDENDLTSQTFAVVGGTGPFIASTSDAGRTTATMAGSTLTVGLGASGNRCVDANQNVTLTVTDTTTGNKALGTLTIKDSGACLQIAPSGRTIGENDLSTYSFTVSGGSGSYAVTTDDPARTSASISGNNLTVGIGTNGSRCVAVASQTVTLTVTDITTAKAAKATLKIVDEGACLQVTPGTLAINDTDIASYVFTISGGSGNYSVTTTDATKAPFTLSGSTLTVNTVAAGTRCLASGSQNVLLTVTDTTTGRQAYSTITITDNGLACP